MSWLPSGHSLDHNLHRDPLISFYPQSVFTKSKLFALSWSGKILPSLASCRALLGPGHPLSGEGWFWWITDQSLGYTMSSIVRRTRPAPASYVLINTQMRGYRDDVRWEWECEPCLRSRLTVEAESRGLTWGGGSVHNDIDIIHKLQSIKNNFISHDWKAW